jgi:hypothetical protein
LTNILLSYAYTGYGTIEYNFSNKKSPTEVGLFAFNYALSAGVASAGAGVASGVAGVGSVVSSDMYKSLSLQYLYPRQAVY